MTRRPTAAERRLARITDLVGETLPAWPKEGVVTRLTRCVALLALTDLITDDLHKEMKRLTAALTRGAR